MYARTLMACATLNVSWPCISGKWLTWSGFSGLFSSMWTLNLYTAQLEHDNAYLENGHD